VRARKYLERAAQGDIELAQRPALALFDAIESRREGRTEGAASLATSTPHSPFIAGVVQSTTWRDRPVTGPSRGRRLQIRSRQCVRSHYANERSPNWPQAGDRIWR
jgi:hypothetical protein